VTKSSSFLFTVTCSQQRQLVRRPEDASKAKLATAGIRNLVSMPVFSFFSFPPWTLPTRERREYESWPARISNNALIINKTLFRSNGPGHVILNSVEAVRLRALPPFFVVVVSPCRWVSRCGLAAVVGRGCWVFRRGKLIIINSCHLPL